MAYPDVQFDDSQYRSRVILGPAETPKMIRFIMRASGGMIRSERLAGNLLFAFVIAAFLVSGVLVFTAGRRTPARLEGDLGPFLPIRQQFR